MLKYEKPGRPQGPEERLRKLRSFKATDEEWMRIKILAETKGMSASEYIRYCCLKPRG